MDQIGAEIYDPFTKTSCVLPNLPIGKFSHTQDGLLLCGGFEDKNTCLTWNQGAWNVSHHLNSLRVGHSSWTPVSGTHTYLMGSNQLIQRDQSHTTDIVGPDGVVEQGFDLHYGAK